MANLHSFTADDRDNNVDTNNIRDWCAAIAKLVVSDCWKTVMINLIGSCLENNCENATGLFTTTGRYLFCMYAKYCNESRFVHDTLKFTKNLGSVAFENYFFL